MTNAVDVDFKRYYYLEILIFIIIRISLLFLEHLYGSLNPSLSMLEGNLPYCDFNELNLDYDPGSHIYPPLFYYIFLSEYLVFGNLILTVRPFFIIFEFLNFILVLKIIILINKNKEFSLIGGIILIFFPLSFIFLAFIEPTIFSLTFMLGGLYFFIKNKTLLSSVCIALGTLLLYIPAILALPILFFYFRRKEYKNMILFFIGLISTILIICLPFLIKCPETFIKMIILSVNTPQSSNISSVIFGEFLLKEILVILGLKIKMINILQILAIILSLVYFNKKYKTLNQKRVIYISIFYIYFIMVLTLYIHPRFIYWTFYLILLILPYDKIKLDISLSKTMKKSFIFSFLYFLLSVYCLVFSWNFQIFSNEIIHMNLIVFFLALYLVLWCIFGLIVFRKDHLCKKLIIYNSCSYIGFILYKLFYEYYNLYEINPWISYFIVIFIVYLIYFMSFRFLKDIKP